ncbi:hypothetical protein BDV93DRAFT_567224, partial [Ceratobasidium sp. AG-I]
PRRKYLQRERAYNPPGAELQPRRTQSHFNTQCTHHKVDLVTGPAPSPFTTTLYYSESTAGSYSHVIPGVSAVCASDNKARDVSADTLNIEELASPDWHLGTQGDPLSASMDPVLYQFVLQQVDILV